MSAFAARLGEADRFSAAADAVRQSFARFRRADGQGLYDVVDGPDGNDASIRPNQIFAASLSHSPLSTADQANVVRVCRRQLLTAFGLRSLAPGSVAYHPHYGGGRIGASLVARPRASINKGISAMKIITLVTTAFLAVLSTAGFIAVLSIVGLLTALSTAGAADLPRKEPPPLAPPVGKAPIGKYPVGKYPIGKYPQPVVTKG
jgi:hypothetical protein